MSKEAPIGLIIMEKLFGLLMIAVGALLSCVTYISLGSLEAHVVFFLGIGVVLIVIGVFLVFAKTE